MKFLDELKSGRFGPPQVAAIASLIATVGFVRTLCPVVERVAFDRPKASLKPVFDHANFLLSSTA